MKVTFGIVSHILIIFYQIWFSDPFFKVNHIKTFVYGEMLTSQKCLWIYAINFDCFQQKEIL